MGGLGEIILKPIKMNEENPNISNDPVVPNKDEGRIIKNQDKKKKSTPKIFKNAIFFFVWFYIIVKVFITDIDLLITQHLGLRNIPLYITLRFICVAIVFLLIWKKIGNTRFWITIIQFFLSPITGFWAIAKYLFWHLPMFLLEKNFHFIAYSYIELLINFFAEFKISMLKILLFVFSFIVLFSLDSYWLFIPISIFSFLQIAHLYKRYKQTFEPIKIFRIQLDSPNVNIDKIFPTEKIEKKERDIENDKISEEEKTFKKMEHTLMMSEFASELSLGVKNILTNRSYLKSLLWKAAFSLFISMIFFGGINYALYKLEPTSFKVESVPTYFNFFYYSFFTIFPDGTDITPLSETAKMVRMAGVSIGFLINLLLLIVYLTVVNDKYKENLNKLIKYANRYSEDAKRYFNKKYGQNPVEMLKKLKKPGSDLENMMFAIRSLFGKNKKNNSSKK